MSLPDPDRQKRVYPKHPGGSYQLALADVIYLGFRITEDGKTKERYPQERVALVLQSMECEPGTANRFALAREFTFTASERGNLRQFLDPWLGPFTSDEHAKTVIKGLDGRVWENGLFSVVHAPARDGSGKVFVNVATAGKLVRGMEPFRVASYTRSDYWTKKIAQYATDHAAFLAEREATKGREVANAAKFPGAGGGLDQRPAALDAEEPDDLPF